MQEHPLISVITAVYNIKEYLPACIESICSQTYNHLEIILVDDGSTDGSSQICDSFALKDHRIQVIHKKNGGLSDARNAGMEIMTGEYVGFVDGDDWIDPEMYESMLKGCLSTDSDLAVCPYKKIGEGMVPYRGTGKTVILNREEALTIYICERPGFLIYNSVWSKLFKRRLVEKLRFPAGKKSEDIMFTTKTFCEATKIAYVDVPFYNYVVDRAGSIMNEDVGKRRFNDEIPFWKEQAAYIDSCGFRELAEKSRYYFYKRMLFYFIEFYERGMKKEAYRLISMLRKEKTVIKRVCKGSFAKTGDKVRLKLALSVPAFYYFTVKMYDKIVIPLRQHGS